MNQYQLANFNLCKALLADIAQEQTPAEEFIAGIDLSQPIK